MGLDSYLSMSVLSTHPSSLAGYGRGLDGQSAAAPDHARASPSPTLPRLHSPSSLSRGQTSLRPTEEPQSVGLESDTASARHSVVPRSGPETRGCSRLCKRSKGKIEGILILIRHKNLS